MRVEFIGQLLTCDNVYQWRNSCLTSSRGLRLLPWISNFKSPSLEGEKRASKTLNIVLPKVILSLNPTEKLLIFSNINVNILATSLAEYEMTGCLNMGNFNFLGGGLKPLCPLPSPLLLGAQSLRDLNYAEWKKIIIIVIVCREIIHNTVLSHLETKKVP